MIPTETQSLSHSSSITYQQRPLTELIAPPLYPVHQAIKTKKYDSIWLPGGRGSTKSSFVALQIAMGLQADPQANCVAVRKVADTLKDSVCATFEWAINLLNWEHFFKITGDEIVYRPYGTKILFRGLDDPQKLKSIKVPRGYFKYLWFEEGAEYSSIEELESVEQSVLRGGQEFIEFVTYNPPVEPKAWINVEAATPKARRLVHETNYTQVPPAWLGPKFLADAEEMRQRRPDKYANVYLGKSIGRSDRIVFSGCCVIRGFTVARQGHRYFIEGAEVDGPYFGADFGFANDPSTLCKCWRAQDGKKIYVEHCVFGYGVKLDSLPALYDQVPGSRKDMIYGDSSRPETIVHVRDRGFIIDAAEKGTGSIEDGIEWLKGHEIVIHDRCKELQDEAIKYVYKVDRVTQTVKSDVVDANNHGWDAIRYAFWQLIKQEPKGILDVDFLAEEYTEPPAPLEFDDAYDDLLV